VRGKALLLAIAVSLLVLLAKPARGESLYDWVEYNSSGEYKDDTGAGRSFKFGPDSGWFGNTRSVCESLCTFDGILSGYVILYVGWSEIYNRSLAKVTGSYRMASLHDFCTGTVKLVPIPQPPYYLEVPIMLNETYFKLSRPYDPSQSLSFTLTPGKYFFC